MSSRNKPSAQPAAVRRENYEEDTIDLLELFKHVIHYWPLLILGMILGAGLLGGTKYIQKYTYTSSSMMYILSSTTSITSLADLQIGTQLSDDFAIMIKSKPVLDKTIEMVEEELGVTLERKDITDALTITQEDSTRILTLACETEDAQLSKVMCNAITEAAAERMSEITQTDPPTIVEYAEVAEEPNSRGTVKMSGLGAVAGLVVMFIILCIPFLTNTKIRKSEDVTKYLDSVVIGVLPYDKSIVSKEAGSHHHKHK